MHIGSKIVKCSSDNIKDPKQKYYGHRVFVNGKFYTDVKCRICGRWYQYEGLKKPVHCGNQACEEWWRRFMQHQFMAKSEMVRDKEYFLRKDVVKKILNNAKNVREVEDGMRRTQIIPEQMIHRKVDRRRMTFATISLKGKGIGAI